MTNQCLKLHQWANNLPIFQFPFDEIKIPKNGIYILFEKGEKGHGTNRIVRIGTHTGIDQLRSRLKQHFCVENKDRSIFRKNIGRSILNKRNDPFLAHWEIDLTTKEAKNKHSEKIDFIVQEQIEKQVSDFIQSNFHFAVIQIDNKNDRLEVESKMISTVSLCPGCRPSQNWLGLHSPKEKIVKSGLWLVNELFKESLSENDFKKLKQFGKLI